MIPVTYIKRNTRALSSCFDKASRAGKPLMVLLYAKLVIIEISGWVEMSMDDVVQRAGRKLKVKANCKYLEDRVVKKNFGFDYEDNFRKMLMQVVGLVELEALEGGLDGAKFQKMKAALALLKQARNTVAHTYVKNPTGGITITAPSLAVAYFDDIYDGLKDFETNMKARRLI